MQTEELALACYGVEVRVVDAAGLELCQRLRDALPPEFVAPSEPAEALVAYVVTAGVLPGTAEDTEYLIACDGVEVFAAYGDELEPATLGAATADVLGIPADACGVVDHQRVGDEWEKRKGATSIVDALLSQLSS